MNVGLILTIAAITALLLLMRVVNKMPTNDSGNDNNNKESKQNSNPNKFYVLFLVIVFIIGYLFMNFQMCSDSNYSGDSIEETIRHGD